MGREFHEHSDDVEFESYNPGCIGGIFTVNVKRIFPHKMYNKGRRHLIGCGNPRTISMEREREPIEIQGLLEGEEGHIQVQPQIRKVGSPNKSSGKACKKGFSCKEKPKEEKHKHWSLGNPGTPKLQHAGSTHDHLGPPGFGLGWMNPIILIRKGAVASNTSLTTSVPEAPRKEVTGSKKPDIHDRTDADNYLEHKKLDKRGEIRTLGNQKTSFKKLNKQVSHNQITETERVDVLEIFKINKDLFLDILQDPEHGIGILRHSKTAKLTKSGSFPMPGSGAPQARYLRSSTLEHKQKEVWFSRKGEKSLAATQLSKSRALRTDNSFGIISTEKASSSTSTLGSDYQRWNTLVMNRFKGIKKRIRQVLKERRKSINRTIVDGLTLQVSSSNTLSTNEREIMSKSLEKTAMEQDIINNLEGSLHVDVSDHGISNGRLNRIRRTKSINESLERYTQLFDYSVSRQADLQHSRSLKLSNEDKVPSKDHVPKIFRRISSLSDLESFCSLLHELSRDALSSDTPLNYEANKENDAHNEPKSISFPEDTDKFEQVEAALEAKLHVKVIEEENCSSADRNGEEIAKPCDFDEDQLEVAVEKSSPFPFLEQGSVFSVSPNTELTQPTSDLSDITIMAEHPIPQGLNHPDLYEGEAESSTFLDRLSSNNSVAFGHETRGNSNRFLLFKSDKGVDPCYNYVRDILDLSGFIQSECLHTWYSLDQPLNPSLYKELETLYHPELECFVDEKGSSCDHQLVFDLVNVALLEISEKLTIYFPKPFSFNCQIISALKGSNVLQEVWKRVSGNLASIPESDQSLDDIIARDLAKDAWNWMNLQAESEFLALELEDLIFDELLHEVLSL